MNGRVDGVDGVDGRVDGVDGQVDGGNRRRGERLACGR